MSRRGHCWSPLFSWEAHGSEEDWANFDNLCAEVASHCGNLCFLGFVCFVVGQQIHMRFTDIPRRFERKHMSMCFKAENCCAGLAGSIRPILTASLENESC